MEKISLKNVEEIKHLNGILQMLLTPRNEGSKNMIMGVSKVFPKEIIKSHVHDYSDECFFVLKGEGELISENEVIEFSKEDCVFIPKGTPHEIHNKSNEMLEVIFCSSPLAPTNEQGHRKIKGV